MFVAYIQLGAGNYPKIGSIVAQCIDIFSKKTYMSSLVNHDSSPFHFWRESSSPRDFPNSWYFNGFDIAIIGGGYNSYHEVVHHQLPSICIPNTNTGMDDQLARANAAASAGGMTCWTTPNLWPCRSRLKKIDPANIDAMKQVMAELANIKRATDPLNISWNCCVLNEPINCFSSPS